MIKKLPTKLGKEPLIDAVFEIRFSTTTSLALVIPGVLSVHLSGSKKFERLPASDLPQQIRDMNPDLNFLPSVKLTWDEKFAILVSEKSVAIGCLLPYLGWTSFLDAISNILKIFKANIQEDNLGGVERYSIKYVDFLEGHTLKEQVSFVDISLNIGKKVAELSESSFQIRLEEKRERFINILQIISSANINLQTGVKQGLVIDIDTINNTGNISFSDFYSSFRDFLCEMHQVNKESFFSCLTEHAVKSLEPEYDYE